MLKFRSTVFVVGLLVLPIPPFAAEEMQLGFELGSHLGDARNHAPANGWSLRGLSENLPGEWIVDGTDAGLFICDNRVMAVRRRLEGTLDDFGSME